MIVITNNYLSILKKYLYICRVYLRTLFFLLPLFIRNLLSCSLTYLYSNLSIQKLSQSIKINYLRLHTAFYNNRHSVIYGNNIIIIPISAGIREKAGIKKQPNQLSL